MPVDAALRLRTRWLIAVLLLGLPAGMPAQVPECPECDRVVARVQRLLPRPPDRIVVVDTTRQPAAIQRRIEESEGFVTVGDNTIHLKKQGSTFQRALRGEGIWDFVLAIIVWHEMAHVAGADEREAQIQEEQLWRQFVVQRRVDSTRGMNFLRLLQNRRKPKL